MGVKGRNPDDHEPLWKQTIKRWSSGDRENYEERAAIMEFCGGQPRDVAEHLAFEAVHDERMRREEERRRGRR